MGRIGRLRKNWRKKRPKKAVGQPRQRRRKEVIVA
jgi:hypothetical protein